MRTHRAQGSAWPRCSLPRVERVPRQDWPPIELMLPLGRLRTRADSGLTYTVYVRQFLGLALAESTYRAVRTCWAGTGTGLHSAGRDTAATHHHTPPPPGTGTGLHSVGRDTAATHHYAPSRPRWSAPSAPLPGTQPSVSDWSSLACGPPRWWGHAGPRHQGRAPGSTVQADRHCGHSPSHPRWATLVSPSLSDHGPRLGHQGSSGHRLAQTRLGSNSLVRSPSAWWAAQ